MQSKRQHDDVESLEAVRWVSDLTHWSCGLKALSFLTSNMRPSSENC